MFLCIPPINYDGQLTNQQGLHSLWESMIPELEMEQYNLFSGHKVRYLRNPIKDVFRAIKERMNWCLLC
jgi:hypothetical protein